MPELPDVTVYVEALERRIVGETLERVRVWNLRRTRHLTLRISLGRVELGSLRLSAA